MHEPDLTLGTPGDRAAIADLLTRFARALDSCDWPSFRAVFTDEIDLDYSSWHPGTIGRWAADDWVSLANDMFPGFTATHHRLRNVLVEVDPTDAERAFVSAEVAAEHVFTSDDGVAAVYTVHGRYEDRCVRTVDGWHIEGKRLVVGSEVGDRNVMDRARRLTAELRRSDPDPK